MLQKERNLADKSKSKYVRTALIQIKRFKRENPDSSDWLEFIIWFNNRKAELCHSTWRNYKASIAYYLKSQDEHDLAYKVETLSNDGTLHKSDKTTSIKKKSLTISEVEKIRESLKGMVNSSNSDTGKHLLAFFECIFAIGNRPTEIPSIIYYEYCPEEFEGLPPVLRITNGKATNGRSFDEFRYIGISELPEKTRLLIKYAVAIANNPVDPQGNPTSYDEFYTLLSRKYGAFIKSIFPKKKQLITLYTSRHQCIANMKNAGYSLAEIALVVGHGNDVTASEHYGKKRYGVKVKLPKHNPKDLPKIKLVYSNKVLKLNKNKTLKVKQ